MAVWTVYLSLCLLIALSVSVETKPIGNERCRVCLDGWYAYGCRCFKFFYNLQTWIDAEKLCLDLDGNLASAHSIEEFTFIQRMIRYEAASSTRAWIGGHDAVQMHFIYLWRSTKCVLAGLGSVFTLMFVLVCSGLFFPYSGDASSPRPKRVFVQHITRSFHALDGSLQSSDSGFWINSLDYTGMQHITPHIPEINDSIHTHCQNSYCDFPLFFSIMENWYLPAPEVSPDAPLEIQLVSRQDTEQGTVNMTFEVKGPSHMILFVLPNTGASLASYAFGDGMLYYDRSRIYLFYSHGLDAPAWNFWLEIQADLLESSDEGLISLAVSAHYFSGSDRRSEQLEVFLKRFPAWVFPSSWISTYHVYRY